jgi:hypothetical protein
MLPQHERELSGRRPFLGLALLGALLLIALVVALAGARPAAAIEAMDFSDVNPQHPYYDAIEGLYWAGVVDGYDTPQGKMFRPEAKVLRAQFAKMILGSLEYEVGEYEWLDAHRPFEDFERDDLEKLYPHDYVATAFRLGITTGKTDTTFQPFVDISRIQVITMVVRAARSNRPAAVMEPPAGWTGYLAAYYSDPNHGENVRTAEYNGLLDGLVGMGPNWDPNATASRGEAAQIMWNLYMAGGPHMVYSDDFSNPQSGWTLKFEADEYKCGYLAIEPKCYSIELFTPEQAAWAWRSAGTYDDFSVGLYAGSVYGDYRGSYGLLFRIQDNGEDFYYFSVSNQGTWSFWKRQGGSWFSVTPSTPSDAITTGAAWNYLSVYAEESDFTFYVNGTEVGSASDGTYSYGWLGFMGEAFDSVPSSGSQMVFDDLEVWALE